MSTVLPAVIATPAGATSTTTPNILIAGDSITSGQVDGGDLDPSAPTYRANLQTLLNGAGATFDFVGNRTGVVDWSSVPGGEGKPSPIVAPDIADGTPGFTDQDHAGQPGYLVDDILNGHWPTQGSIQNWVTDEDADIVIIHAGTVDALDFSTTLTDSATQMTQIITSIRSQNPEADIVLVNIGALDNGVPNIPARAATWNTLLSGVVLAQDTPNSRVLLADVTAQSYTNADNLATGDGQGILPAASGQAKIAQAIFDAMSGAGLINNLEPTSTFTDSCATLACTFAATAADSDGSIASYSWDFGDGNTATGANPPVHNYAGGGSFDVTLTTTDNDGAQDSTTETVVVSSTNMAPTASFTADCSAGLSCDFDGSASADADGAITTFAWDFGDGDTSTGASDTATHTYDAFQTYTVTLTVTDNVGASTSTSMSVTNSPACSGGYWLGEQDGNVYAFGNAQNLPVPAAGAAIVDIEATPDGCGYWVIRADGSVAATGSATALGNFNLASLEAGEALLSVSPTVTGQGLWGFTTRGRVLTLGDAVSYGDLLDLNLNGPIIDSVRTASGEGYYMLGSDGGIFTKGDAVYAGSVPGLNIGQLNEPAVGLTPDPDGNGYWVVAADGGVFSFNAPFRGSFPALGLGSLNAPIIGMVSYGNGYLQVATDGGVFNFSNLPFSGSLGANPPNTPIVAITPLP